MWDEKVNKNGLNLFLRNIKAITTFNSSLSLSNIVKIQKQTHVDLHSNISQEWLSFLFTKYLIVVDQSRA